MNENEAYMIPECNLYRTKVFSQEPTCKRPLTKEPLPMANFDSAHQLELKMMHVRERLIARIENEGYLICAELKRQQQDNSPAAKNMIQEIHFVSCKGSTFTTFGIKHRAIRSNTNWRKSFRYSTNLDRRRIGHLPDNRFYMAWNFLKIRGHHIYRFHQKAGSRR